MLWDDFLVGTVDVDAVTVLLGRVVLMAGDLDCFSPEGGGRSSSSSDDCRSMVIFLFDVIILYARYEMCVASALHCVAS